MTLKPKTYTDVRELLQKESFTTWHQRYQELLEDIRDSCSRLTNTRMVRQGIKGCVEVLQHKGDNCLFQAGELDARAAIALAEHNAIENDSFEALSNFEQQRLYCSVRWDQLGVQENNLENLRQQLSEMIAASQAAERSQMVYSQADADHLQREINTLQQQIEELRSDYREFIRLKEELWQQVETEWSHSFAVKMAHTTQEYLSRKLKMKAEALYAQSHRVRLGEQDCEDQDKEAASGDPVERPPEALKEDLDRFSTRAIELEQELEQHRDTGREIFMACIVEDFMFWPRKDNVKWAFVVPLVEDREFLNIQVQPLVIYQIERARGLDFIEPFILEQQGVHPDENDLRLEDFFKRPNRADKPVRLGEQQF